MKLRRKLLTLFSSLALLSVASSGVTIWAIAQWFNSEDRLQGHYQRSLIALEVKAANYRAIKEILDTVLENDANAREDFEEILKPVEKNLQLWTELADNDAERQQVQQVRQAYNNLVKHSRAIFDYTAQGRKDLALNLMETQLEEVDFPQFETVIKQAVESDKKNRQIVLKDTRSTRQTSRFVLMLSGFGIISLILLLAAYLSADLFIPLQQMEVALDDAARGNFQRHLDEERQDELGAINRAFNHMMEKLAQRQQDMEMVNKIAEGEAGLLTNKTGGNNAPSRLILHQLVSQVRSQFSQLYNDSVNINTNGNVAVAVDQQQELMNQLDQLLQVVTRVTEFGFPLDLNLASTDIRILIHEVLLRFHARLVERNISFEIGIAPEVENAIVDRLKLREVLAELVRNALSALPERGGRLGIRTFLDTPVKGKPQLLIEVADNGTAVEQPLIERAFVNVENIRNRRSHVGLKLAKDIIEQHGGTLKIDSQPGVGTKVQIQLPWREA
jgi:two-component system, OmpR family, sensor kinase